MLWFLHMESCDDFGGTNMTAWKDVTLESSVLETTTGEASVSIASDRRAADRSAVSDRVEAVSFRKLKGTLAGPFGRVLDRSAMGGERSWLLPASIVAICLGGAVYGAALGAWQGSTGIGAAAIKLPVALLATVAVAMILNCGVARGLGLRVGCAQAARVTVLAMAVASALLGTLAAGSWLVGALFSSLSIASISTQLTEMGARLGVGALGIVQIPLIGLAGLGGASVLWHALGRFGRCPRQRRRVFIAWLLVLASIGGPILWMLQPLAGEGATGAAFERTARVTMPALR